MQIRLGYDIRFDVWNPVPIVALLSVHPSRRGYLQGRDQIIVDNGVNTEEYIDSFGNICTRILAPPGILRLSNSVIINDSGLPDEEGFDAREVPVEELPADVLRFLMGSRFCEVDLLSPVALELFGHLPKGWSRVRAVCDWVHQKVT